MNGGDTCGDGGDGLFGLGWLEGAAGQRLLEFVAWWDGGHQKGVTQFQTGAMDLQELTVPQMAQPARITL